MVYHNAIRGDNYFDVLLLDVIMPRLNGIAVGMNVRNLEHYSDGSVPRAIHIYLTGKEDAVPPERLMEAELAGDLFADAYFHKPIGSDELLAEIERLVREARDAARESRPSRRNSRLDFQAQTRATADGFEHSPK